jgi:hypothetical protein
VALSLRQARHPAHAHVPQGEGRDVMTEDQLEERNARLRAAVVEREVIVGMDMRQVRSILGQPDDVETAGDSGSGNQRWVYPLGLSDRFGLGAQRMLYFEDGKLVGWENRQGK